MFSLRRRRSDREGEHGFVDVVVAGGDGQLRNLVGFIGKKLEYEGAEQRISKSMTRETGGRNGSGLSRVETLLDHSPLHAHPDGHYVVHFQQQLQRFLDVEALKVESFSLAFGVAPNRVCAVTIVSLNTRVFTASQDGRGEASSDARCNSMAASITSQAHMISK